MAIYWPNLLVLVFISYPCLSPGEPSQRKRSPEGALQDQSPAKRVVRCVVTGSEGTVEAVGVSSSASVVSGGAVAAERSPPICEGELCGVSPSVRLGWNRPCLSSLSPSPSINGVQCFKLKLQELFVTSVHPTTHAPHVSTLISAMLSAVDWSLCGLYRKLSNGSLHVIGHSPMSPNTGGPANSGRRWSYSEHERVVVSCSCKA